MTQAEPAEVDRLLAVTTEEHRLERAQLIEALHDEEGPEERSAAGKSLRLEPLHEQRERVVLGSNPLQDCLPELPEELPERDLGS